MTVTEMAALTRKSWGRMKRWVDADSLPILMITSIPREIRNTAPTTSWSLLTNISSMSAVSVVHAEHRPHADQAEHVEPRPTGWAAARR